MFAADALFFEEYFCLSHDAMNTGFGWSLISSYMTFPFLPTLVTRYLLTATTPMAWYYLVAIGLLNACGYIIYRYPYYYLDFYVYFVYVFFNHQ